jgi:hypothetical protein
VMYNVSSVLYRVNVTRYEVLAKVFVCLFVWGPVSGCTAACGLIVHTPCVFNVPTFTARRLEILAAKGETCRVRNFR